MLYKVFIKYIKKISPSVRLLLKVILICIMIISITNTAFANKIINDPLKVEGDFDYPPYYYLNNNNKPDGFNIELLKSIANVMGLNINIEMKVWSQVRKNIENKNIDIVAGMFYSEERDKTVDFTTPFINVTYAIFVRKDSRITELNDLKNKTLILQKNDIAHDFALNNLPNTSTIDVDEPINALRLLSSGKHNAAIISRLQGLYLINEYNLKNLKVVGEPLFNLEFCYAVKEGDIKLQTLLNEGLNIIKNNDTYDEIYDKWFGIYHKHGLEDFYTLLWVLIPVSVILIVALLWSWSLKREVKRKTRTLKNEIEERKKIEALLKKERDRAEKYLDIVEVIILVMDEQGNVKLINRKGLKITEYKEDEIIGKNWYDTCINEADKKGMKNIHKKIASKQIPFNEEYGENSIITKSGKERIIAWHTTLIKDGSNGTIVEILSSGEDITNRKLAEEKLKESEKRYRNLVKYSPTAVLVHSDGKVLFVNDEAIKILHGNDISDFIGKNINNFIYRENPVFMGKNANKNKLMLEQEKLLCVDNSIIDVEVSSSHIDYMKKPAVQVTFRDITKRLKAEEALKESEAKYRTLFDTANDGIFIIKNNKIIDCNNKITKLFGYSKDKIIGNTPYNLSPKYQINGNDSKSEAVKYINKVLEGKPQHFEWLHQHKNGNILTMGISLNTFNIYNETFIMAIVRDITQQKEYEKALIESEKKYRELVELIPYGIVEVDTKGNIIFYNPAYEKMLGYNKDELMGVNILDLRPNTEDAEKAGKYFDYVIKTEPEPSRYFGKVETKDNKIIDVQIDWSYEKDEEGKIKAFINIVSDITEQKRSEEQIRNLNEYLEQRVAKRTAQLEYANKELEAFAYSVSHDLRAPLRSIEGFSQAILEDYEDKLDEEGKDYLNRLANASQKMSQLIQDILYLSRVSRKELQYKEVDLTKLS
ncbi:MAG: PAS domain S-box protein, partial [Spirochaetota bacterium]